jgi:uncharacterized damage-inducible protein DinB
MKIVDLYQRDIDKLIEEINLFKKEKNIWKIKGEVKNPVGNLTLHLLGNLNHFIGRTLGNTDYIRKREDEFSVKNISREKLISDLVSLKEVITTSLGNLSDEDLKKEFPLKIRDEILTTELLLIYLLNHFNYHLGQINYLRRIIE